MYLNLMHAMNKSILEIFFLTLFLFLRQGHAGQIYQVYIIKRTSSRANKYIGTCSGESDGYDRFQIEILRQSFHLIKGKIHAFNYIANCVGLTVEFLYGICQCNNLKGK